MGSDHPSDKEIFAAARQLSSPESIAEYLQRVCGDDERRHERIRALLEADMGDSFLQKPPMPLCETEMQCRGKKPGDQIANYKLLHLLGEGGMGTVYLAEQQKPVKRRVAVKIIKQGMNTDQFIARFEAERQALAMMDHPNIAKVLDAGCTDDRRPYFVMELVKGVPINEFCDRNRLSTNQRLELFVRVCQAVQHAHQKGIIHRDLKPSNIMVAMYDDCPVPKVIDFGVAKATHQPLTEQTLYTVPGQIVGTWEYMSPEQAILNQLDVDTRTDIYSLGVILYELLTGETPLDLRSLEPGALEERLRRIREQEPSRPSIKVSGLGQAAAPVAAYRSTEPNSLAQAMRGDLDWIVMKALEKDRSKRYETASGFAAEIMRFLNDEPLSFRPPSNWAQFARLCRRNKAVVTTTALAVSALALGLVIAYWQYVVANERATELTESKAILQLRNNELSDALSSLRLQQRIAEDRLGIVKDYTMLLARTGDERNLELAIKVASVVGASKVWKLMLEAQYCIDRGELNKAIEFLEQGIRQQNDPELLACKGLHASALILNGQSQAYLPLQRELERSVPTTPEQLVFVGVGLQCESKTWWDMANQAVTLRDSLFARLNRALAAAAYAIDSGNLTIAEQGIEDLTHIQESVIETPWFIANRLQVHLAAMILSKDPDSIEAWKSQADQDVKLLKEVYPGYKWGLLVTAWYKDQFDRESADEAWEAVLERGAGGWHDIHAAAMIIRKGNFDRWRDRLTGGDRLERICVAALLADGDEDDRRESLRIYEKVIGSLSIVNFRLGVGFEVPLIARKVERARADAAKLLDDKADFLTDFDKSLVQCLAGRMPLSDFETRLSQFDKVEQLMGHFIVGLHALAKDDVRLARRHFQKTRDTGVYHTSDYYWARAYLEILDDENESSSISDSR